MNANDIVIVVGAFVGLLATMGAGGKFLLLRMDEKNKIAAGVTAELTLALSNRLHAEISSLRDENRELHKENRLYLRRIYLLEAFIHKQPSINIPEMDGWPPI